MSGGEEAAAAEWICRVYEDDVNVAGELQMLEAVVEDEPIYAAVGEFPALCVAICAYAEIGRDCPGGIGAYELRRWLW